ncbi:hypothetical protein VTK56DRAFT_1370 [Thermocarpiscus australiensis]
MSSSSAIPPGGPSKSGTPGKNRPAAAGGAPFAEPAWPLPRKPVPTDAASSAPDQRKQGAGAPPPSGGAARIPDHASQARSTSQTPRAPQVPPPRSKGLSPEQGSARLNIPGRWPERTADEAAGPRAPAPIPQQPKGIATGPPPIGVRAQQEPVIPSFPFPKPPATENSSGAAKFADSPLPKPLRSVPVPSSSGPAPSSQYPDTPAPLRPGPRGPVPPAPGTAAFGTSSPLESRAGQPVPDALRPGMARQAQPSNFLPEQPGRAPSKPVPPPAKRPQRTETQGIPQPLRVGNLVPKSQNAAELKMNRAGAPAVSDSDQPFTAFSPPTPPKQAGATGPFTRKPVNTNPFGTPPPSQPWQAGAPSGSRLQVPVDTNPLRSSPPNPPLPTRDQAGSNPGAYRPGMPKSPPERPGGFAASVTSPPGRAPPSNAVPPRATGPSRLASPPRFGPTYPGSNHGHFNSLDSNASDDTVASSATATSTKPLNPLQRRNTGFSNPTRQDTGLSRSKTSAGNGGPYGTADGEGGGGAQTPYMSMLLSLDKIPRLHNILVSFFAWILLAGYVVIPGSFTSVKRKQEEGGIEIPIGGGGAGKLVLTRANTAAMVIGFVCICAGMFGLAWLALRWRRNYVWLLNKLYMPLILNSLAGLLATVTSVYAQQAGDWSTQATITAILEASILGVNMLFFFVYNYWLLQRIRDDHEETVTGVKEKEKKKNKKKKKNKRMGLLARLRRARKKPPIAAGSVV